MCDHVLFGNDLLFGEANYTVMVRVARVHMTACTFEPIRLDLVVHFLACDLAFVKLCDTSTTEHIVIDVVLDAALVLGHQICVVLLHHHQLALCLVLAQACTQEQAFTDG